MSTLIGTELVGFLELQIGSIAVKVPIRAHETEEPETAEPLATFEAEGESCAILVRGDATSMQVEHAMRSAANDAVRHLSRKLLN